VVLAARAFRYWCWPDLAACCAALGLALATKHSAPVIAILLSIVGVILLFVVPLAQPSDTRSRRFLKLGLVFLGAFVILWSFYRFRFTESPVHQEVFNRPLAEKIADLHSPFRRFVLTKIAVSHLLPRPYIWGLADTIRGGIEGRLETRLFYGRLYYGNPPKYFFPGILAAKLPLGFSFLILLGLFLFLARRLPSDWNIPILVVLFVSLGFFLVLANGATYGGMRHALPVALLLSIFGGFSVHAALSTDFKLLRWAVPAGFLAAAASALPVLRPYEYYNELVAMEKAALYFNDEGLEAEQRGKELLRYYFENLKPIGEVPYLLYDIPELAGRVRGLDWVGRDPERDSARFNTRIASGTIFVGGRYLGPRPFWDSAALRNAKPVARFGNLLVYHGTFDLPGGLAHARYWDGLTKIYTKKPDLATAEQLLRQSAQLDPAQFFVHIEIGNLCLNRASREEALRAYNDALNYAPDLPFFRQPIRDQIHRVSTETLSQIPPLRNPELE
jgi:tetratricopeptide (TPR) repeat protein